MNLQTCDLIVIGGGPGGYTAAIRAAQSGLKVLLIEKDSMGGTCLNRGCISTKSFVHDAKLFHAAKSSSLLKGAQGLSMDYGKMAARKREVVKGLVGGLEAIIRSNGIQIVSGRGELLAPGRVRCVKQNGPPEEYRASHIILATGSRPSVPPFIQVDGKFVQTTDEALDAREMPESIIILGGGVIGVEMAAIHLNLGCRVTILEMLPDILATEDEEIRRLMKRLLTRRGAEIHLGATVKEVAVLPESGGRVRATFQDREGRIASATAHRLLAATGRAPVLDGLDPAKTGLALDGRFVKVDSACRTNLPGVYAIGDLVGGLMLAHKAAAEAEAAVEAILGHPGALRPERIPRCIWGVEEVGAVGLTEEQAAAGGRRIRTGKFPLLNSGAARAMGSTDGLVKIVGDEQTGEILGIHIIGARATDLISEAVTAMNMEGAVEDLAEGVKPHPTISETLFEAALDWNSRAIHSMAAKMKHGNT